MQRLYIFLLTLSTFGLWETVAHAQVPNNPANTDTTQPLIRDTTQPLIRDTTQPLIRDTTQPVTSLNAELLNILNQKTAQKYKIAGIKITGNKYFDEALLIS